MLIIRKENETPFDCLRRIMRRENDVRLALRLYVNGRRRISIDIYSEAEWQEKVNAERQRAEYLSTEGDLE